MRVLYFLIFLFGLAVGGGGMYFYLSRGVEILMMESEVAQAKGYIVLSRQLRSGNYRGASCYINNLLDSKRVILSAYDGGPQFFSIKESDLHAVDMELYLTRGVCK